MKSIYTKLFFGSIVTLALGGWAQAQSSKFEDFLYNFKVNGPLSPVGSGSLKMTGMYLTYETSNKGPQRDDFRIFVTPDGSSQREALSEVCRTLGAGRMLDYQGYRKASQGRVLTFVFKGAGLYDYAWLDSAETVVVTDLLCSR